MNWRQITEVLKKTENKIPKRQPNKKKSKSQHTTYFKVLFKIPKEWYRKSSLQPKKMVSKLKAYTVLKTKAPGLIG